MERLTLPSNLEYSLKGLLSCWGHCSSRSERVDLVPAVRGLSLKSRFSNKDPRSSTGQEADITCGTALEHSSFPDKWKHFYMWTENHLAKHDTFTSLFYLKIKYAVAGMGVTIL